MHADKKQIPLDELTRVIIGCAYTVSNTIGHGFLEKVYENALCIELAKHGFSIRQQAGIPVHYDGIIVGDYFADIVINDLVILELKALKSLDINHHVQRMNYLIKQPVTAFVY